MVQSPMRLLFITATRVGDAVLSTGLLSHLTAAHPGLRITVAAGEAAIPLFEAVPGIETLIPIRKARYGAHWLRLWRACAGRRWDIVVDLRRSLIAWTLHAGKRHVVPKAKTPMHRVELMAATLGLAHNPPAPTLWVDDRHAAVAARLIPDGAPVLAVAPAANWRGKQWRAEHFASLIGRLTGPAGVLPDARVAVFAAPTEDAQARAVLESVSPERRIDTVGKIDLPAVAACLRRCAFFVGNDSGLMHMAAASGIPTLGLFGPSRVEHYAPWGPNTAWVRTEQSYETLVGAPGYDHRTTDTLMDGLTVEMAEQAACDLWRRIGDTSE
jgi:ADP-heptose:LPS heptosyltransferase